MTPTEFKARYPEFASTADAVVAAVIADADPFFDVTRWGDFYAQGLAAFTAHELTIAAAAALGDASALDAAAISQKRVGDVSVSYSVTMMQAGVDDPYQRTRYGQRYASLRDMVGMGAVTP